MFFANVTKYLALQQFGFKIVHRRKTRTVHMLVLPPMSSLESGLVPHSTN